MKYLCNKISFHNTEKILLDDFFKEISFDFRYTINSFDLLICREVDTRKSTFINKLIYEKVLKGRKGLSLAYKATQYVHPKYPDIPGFFLMIQFKNLHKERLNNEIRIYYIQISMLI